MMFLWVEVVCSTIKQDGDEMMVTVQLEVYKCGSGQRNQERGDSDIFYAIFDNNLLEDKCCIVLIFFLVGPY
jgi:hypothetical protein